MTSPATTNTILIVGNTYPVKDALRELGGRWDAAQKGWRVPADVADKARALVASAATTPSRPTSSPTAARTRRPWRPCGYPGCNPRYCDECDGEGYTGR